ncbi:MAG TPA: NAD(P)/FAD-dependent oxidoreductase [Gammaproteobacteria bacterium]|nr:NAD(P)/FAD-dependent oxidoreductase [Gammaproteobacteria bacterium]
MERCDVLVVGGGPAGSTLARRLGRTGFDVMVLDKETFPRDKVCAGWITPEVIETVGLEPEAYASERVFQPIRTFRAGLIDGPLVETEYEAAASYGIRRCEFDHYLLERSGARLAQGELLKGLERDGDEWVVNDRIRTPLVVGAGGHFCPVARHLGARPGRDEPTVTAKEIEYRLEGPDRDHCPVAPGVPELYFCPDLKGYGWIVRKGDYLNIGLGRENSPKLAHHLDGFIDSLAEAGRLPPGGIPQRFHGHAYRVYGADPRRRVADGVLLIGDAAGLAYPQSGEGIRPAVESAVLATRAIEEARGDYRAANLQGYLTDLHRRFGNERPTGTNPGPLRTFVGNRLLRNGWFVRNFVVDRWFLHRSQPALIA